MIDDDPGSRELYSLYVEELSMQALRENGPFTSVEACVERVLGAAHAAISDFKLKVKTYASFNGAELVASLYDKKLPSILCTRFEFADLDEIRPYRQRIPALLRPDELDVDTIAHAFESCALEFRNEFVQTRKPWKTLIRIEDIHADPGREAAVDVCLPSWNRNVMVKLQRSELPEWMHAKLVADAHFYAVVNIGAERPEDLYFSKWSES
ncbi:MAG TPA: hypothetical protein VNO30_29980 [Kofleriaceae bacterium]|nr:hypothetical protein [Kofleriaceae bacterium]